MKVFFFLFVPRFFRNSQKHIFLQISNLDEKHEYDNKTFFDNISCDDFLTYQLQFKWKTALDEIKNTRQNANEYKLYQEEIEASQKEIGPKPKE